MVTPFQTVASRDVSSQVLLLESGRKLGFAEYGDPAGTPVFAFHGAPGNNSNNRRRAFSARFIGDDATFIKRKGETSPPIPEVTLRKFEYIFIEFHNVCLNISQRLEKSGFKIKILNSKLTPHKR